jgi:hypothetical protein
MPPLKQPKELSFHCYSSFSIHCAKCIQDFQSEIQTEQMREFFSDLPSTILEVLGSWIVQSASGLLHCLSGGAQLDLDDKVFFNTKDVFMYFWMQ